MVAPDLCVLRTELCLLKKKKKRYIEVLTPNMSEYDLIWELGPRGWN